MHLMQTSFPPLGLSSDGEDGASLGHPASGPLGVRLDPQDPHGRDDLGPAQGELMSKLQLASSHSCQALCGPMTVQHAPYLCAGIPRMRTHCTDIEPANEIAKRGSTKDV